MRILALAILTIATASQAASVGGLNRSVDLDQNQDTLMLYQARWPLSFSPVRTLQ
jgi:hypothetical protein